MRIVSLERLAWVTLIAVLLGGAAWAQQQDPPRPNQPDAAATDAQRIAEQMRQRMDQAPALDTATSTAPAKTKAPVYPSAGAKVDPRVLGTPPGSKQPTLRREGEFIPPRRGRLVRSDDGGHSMFVFAADGKSSPQPPMVLLPCRMLQSMEDLVAERGENMVFILTGQVFTYRGMNYLLPSVFKLDYDRGNLKP